MPRPSASSKRPARRPHSARTVDALAADAEAVVRSLATNGSRRLYDWCAAAATTRKPRAVRLAIVARSLDQLADRLHLFLLAPERASLRASRVFASTSP